MKIELIIKDQKGQSIIGNHMNVDAAMSFSIANQKLWIINHTEVSEALRGQGVGEKLLFHIVDHARSHNIKIIPLCPFAKSVFDKKSDIIDVLHH